MLLSAVSVCSCEPGPHDNNPFALTSSVHGYSGELSAESKDQDSLAFERDFRIPGEPSGDHAGFDDPVSQDTGSAGNLSEFPEQASIIDHQVLKPCARRRFPSAASSLACWL